jgi:hypothetical protein
MTQRKIWFVRLTKAQQRALAPAFLERAKSMFEDGAIMAQVYGDGIAVTCLHESEAASVRDALGVKNVEFSASF